MNINAKHINMQIHIKQNNEQKFTGNPQEQNGNDRIKGQ